MAELRSLAARDGGIPRVRSHRSHVEVIATTVPDESIDRAAKAAYLAWTGRDESPERRPSWLGDEASAVDGAVPSAALAPERPARVMRWEEIEAYMDAATDISGQVRSELAATESAAGQLSTEQTWRSAARPSVA